VPLAWDEESSIARGASITRQVMVLCFGLAKPGIVSGDANWQWVAGSGADAAPLIHSPWRASAAQLSEAGVRLGIDYPHPIVAHDAARERALLALAYTKGPRNGA
jgi:hypothetical protein